MFAVAQFAIVRDKMWTIWKQNEQKEALDLLISRTQQAFFADCQMYADPWLGIASS
jgi:hypothetical protein